MDPPHGSIVLKFHSSKRFWLQGSIIIIQLWTRTLKTRSISLTEEFGLNQQSDQVQYPGSAEANQPLQEELDLLCRCW